jgi:GH25 family lysozyme M1 (1,4-beta-N-acetylmuramidase)
VNRFGVDVSSFQGSVSWAKAKGHIAFVFCRSWMGDVGGEGAPDPTFNHSRVRAIRKAGIPFGPYCFARNSANVSGKLEAQRFVAHAKKAGWGKKGDLPGVLDIEAGEQGRPGTRFVRQFAREYKRLTGHRVIVYTGSFWRDALRNPVTLTRSRLFLAAYTSTWHGYVPRAWKKPSLWQFTESASCPGASGNVDGDRWLKSRRAFERMRLTHDL